MDKKKEKRKNGRTTLTLNQRENVLNKKIKFNNKEKGVHYLTLWGAK